MFDMGWRLFTPDRLHNDVSSFFILGLLQISMYNLGQIFLFTQEAQLEDDTWKKMSMNLIHLQLLPQISKRNFLLPII